jgi:dihydrofolate reductase
MKGGTVFRFVTGGIEQALQRAQEAAGGKDIRLGGGVATVRQYLRARLIDENAPGDGAGPARIG